MGLIVLLFLKNYLWAEANELLEMFISSSFYCFIVLFFLREKIIKYWMDKGSAHMDLRPTRFDLT